MLKKALRWLTITLIVFTLLLVLSGIGLYFYVSQNEHRAVREAAEQLGLEVTYARAKPSLWKTFPKVSVTIDSLTIRDLQRKGEEPDLLKAESIHVAFSVKKMLRDTLMWEELSLQNARIYLAADSLGQYNLGDLVATKDSLPQEKDPQSPSLLNPHIDLNGVVVSLEEVDVSYLDPPKQKRMEVCFDSANVIVEAISSAQAQLSSCLNASVRGLSFNTAKGSYLKNSSLRGCVEATLQDDTWVLDSTSLQIGPDQYEVAGTVGPEGLHLEIASDALDYQRARAMLHDTLQARLGDYYVEGPFKVAADIYNEPGGGNDVDLTIQFTTNDQSVRLKDFQFHHVTTTGAFVNSMPEGLGGNPFSTTEFTIQTDTTVAIYDGMVITSPHALVRGWPTDTYLKSPINMTGRAAALARLFGNTEFLFNRGGFTLNTNVDASLNRVEEIINTSDGDLTLRNLKITYAPSQVSFPMERIRLDKVGKDVRFNLKSGEIADDLQFDMVGYLDNILPLLLERPADSLRTEVIFHAEKGSWSSFRSMFGEEGYFSGEPASPLSQEQQVHNMKQTLLGLGAQFRPHLQMVIDTLAYYDVLTLVNFRAGLEFDRDTLVLEKSRFDWGDGSINLRAKVKLSDFNSTPFSIAVEAEQLDLNALRRPLTSFGLRLPSGLNQLPDNLDIDFNHKGIINDTLGIQPGYNYGQLDFRDGRENLFTGSVKYAPGENGLATKLLLEGDPAIVNDLFAAQDFFFGSGNFSIDLSVSGQPSSLEELMKQSDLNLVIENSKVLYQPAGVFIPLDRMVVDAIGDETTFAIALTSNATRRSVALTGVMDRLSAFLYPKEGEPFNLKADLEAERLHLSDVSDFITAEDAEQEVLHTPDPTGEKDTAHFDPQLLLSTGQGIFSSFNPAIRLKVDTFQVDSSIKVTNLHAGIRLLDSTLLRVEDTGFSLGDGTFDLSATYSLDQQETSPFTLQWKGEALSLNGLGRTLYQLNMGKEQVEYEIKGRLSTAGDVRGVLNETIWNLPLERITGDLNLSVEAGELANLPLLKKVGRKALMRKRFEKVLLGPVDILVSMDSGRMSVPLAEIQSTALQFFVEGHYDTVRGPDLLISLPLRNIGRGKLLTPPLPTGYALAGRKVYVVVEPDDESGTKVRFRLGRRKYYRDRGMLSQLKQLKEQERQIRREVRRKRRLLRRNR